jgi:N-methylhydantoinase B
VLRDIAWGKVSVEGAWRDYGVRVSDGELDQPASDEARARRRGERTGEEPFFDRGPGYSRLSGGRAHADVDFV